MIKLKHPIFGFEQSNIELGTLFNQSLMKRPKILEHYILMVNVHLDILIQYAVQYMNPALSHVVGYRR